MIVKVCGLTRIEDAVHAVDVGVDWIGLNFWAGSRRHVPVARAREIADAVRGRCTIVGVFVNAPADEVEGRAARVGLDLLQFHGDEDPSYLAAFAGRCLRAVRVAGPADLDAVATFTSTDTILLDAASPGYGGSGQTFDWALARAASAHGKRILVAGGLTPENVAQAVRAARPYGVDVAGGVEAAPGIKDHGKLARFVAAARAAARERED